MKTLRFGIIGCGMMGREFASAAARWFHLPEMNLRPEIVAICRRNLSAESTDWFKDNIPTLRQVTDDYRELLDNPEVEVTDKAPEKKPAPAPSATNESKSGFWWGTGRRKTSVARVRIKPGDGKLVVNKKELNEYFRRPQDQDAVLSPIKAVQAEGKFEMDIMDFPYPAKTDPVYGAFVQGPRSRSDRLFFG